MTELAQKKCKPCEGGVAPLTRDAAQELLAQLEDGWTLAADTRSIRRELAFKDFYRTMSFVNAVAHLANIEDHHPDLEVGYNYCRPMPSRVCQRTTSSARRRSIPSRVSEAAPRQSI
jgi:4a-hydroxytetrahydrobiopterin dehydratase